MQPWEQFTPATPKQPWENYTPPQPGFLDRVGGDVQKRLITAVQQDNPSLLGLVGNVGAGTFNDIAGEAVKSIPGATAVGNAISSGAQKVAQPVANAIDSIAPAIGDKLLGASDTVSDLAKANPNAAYTLNGVGNMVKGNAIFNTVAPPAIALGQKVTADLPAIQAAVQPVPHSGITSTNVADLAKRSFDAADTSGGVLTPDAADGWLKRSSSLVPQSERGIAAAGEDAATKFINSQMPFQGKPMSLADARELYTTLGNQIEAEVNPITGKMSNTGRNLYSMQQDLRDTLMNAKPEDLLGGADGVAAWREGQKLWTIQTRMADIERLLAKAEAGDVPATAIKNAFKNYVNRPGNLTGLPDDVVYALKSAGRTGIVTGALKTLGSKFTAGVSGGAAGGLAAALGGGIPGAAISGMAGAGVAGAAGYPLRMAANALQRAPVQEALDRLGNSAVIDEAVMPPIITPTAPAPLALPAPQTTITVDQAGNAIPLTPAGREAIGTQAVQSSQPVNMKEIMKLPPEQARAALESYLRNKNYRR